MLKKLVFLSLVVLLVACSDDEDNKSDFSPQTTVEQAEAVLQAFNHKDVDTASEFLCQKDIDGLRDAPPTDSAPIFADISCNETNNTVTCTYNIEKDGERLARNQEIVFDIMDGKLCSQ